jgi:SAM-dependent methyltransferase
VRDRSIDFVLCADVLEYIESRQRKHVIRELVRICKPRGKIVISIPNADCIFNPIRPFLHSLLNKRKSTYTQSSSPFERMGEMISGRELRQYGFSVRGCLGWVTRLKIKMPLLADLYDEFAWRIPRLGGTLVGILDTRAKPARDLIG